MCPIRMELSVLRLCSCPYHVFCNAFSVFSENYKPFVILLQGVCNLITKALLFLVLRQMTLSTTLLESAKPHHERLFPLSALCRSLMVGSSKAVSSCLILYVTMGHMLSGEYRIEQF